MGKLDGKVALVTGGGRHRAGHRAAVRRRGLCRRPLRRCLGKQEDVAAEVGAPVVAHHADVSSEDEVKGMVEVVRQTWGRLDVLVNNAGISSSSGGRGVRCDP